MRTSLACALLALTACGESIDHPDRAPACDPATTDCSYPPPSASKGGGQVGSSSGGDAGAPGDDPVGAWSGEVVVQGGLFFERSSAYGAGAEVSADGAGKRVNARATGGAFELEGVLKTEENWFLVEPDSRSEVLPTITPVDTVTKSSGGIPVLTSLDVDQIFMLSLVPSERALQRAQLVLTVIDEQGRGVSGITARAGAEVVVYRSADFWAATEGMTTDNSGMVFLGNIPASSALARGTVTLAGARVASIDVRLKAGAVTLATVVVGEP
jgi:hypothetical protein